MHSPPFVTIRIAKFANWKNIRKEFEYLDGIHEIRFSPSNIPPWAHIGDALLSIAFLPFVSAQREM